MKALTITETAEMLKVGTSTIRRLLDKGLIKAHRIGDQIRITEEEIEKFLSQNPYTVDKTNKRNTKK